MLWSAAEWLVSGGWKVSWTLQRLGADAAKEEAVLFL